MWTGWWFSSGTAGERRLAALLTEKLNPTHIEVRDISGIYQIELRTGGSLIPWPHPTGDKAAPSPGVPSHVESSR